MKPFKTDIAVALIFFNRPEPLKEVFAAVAEARPSRLYLIQDGARENRPSDKENIEACREIVNKIDWECDVVKDYSDINLGCGKRIFSGLTNMFQKEEYAAIIEDDIVVGESFLPFVKEMCERYKEDQRIQMISGMNHIGVYEDCPYDYFFSKGAGAIWGWATWRSRWMELDWNFEAASNPYISMVLDDSFLGNMSGKDLNTKVAAVRNNILKGIPPSFWSLHFGYYTALGSRLNIVPKYNLITNIGLTSDATHGQDNIKKIVRRMRPLFYGRRYTLRFPLKHPDYVLDDQHFMHLQNKIMFKPHVFRLLLEYIERAYIKMFVR